MIVYNMRNRGPLEYDKFILNILQYYNEVNSIKNKISKSDGNKALQEMHKQIDDIYSYYIGREESVELSQEKRVSYSKELYFFLLNYRER